MSDPTTETVNGPVPAHAPALLSAGTVVDDRYVIRRLLGYGGSAVVYGAFDRALRHEIALKILRPDRVSETAIRRLQREVSTARRTSHPHLIRVHDIGESSEGTYLTMEFFDAPTLRTYMHGRHLAIEDVVRIAEQIVEALGALHSLGIVHRDIKPSNILIASDGLVKVGDFGLALQLEADESRLTQTAVLVGTLEYLSPEQALGSKVDQRSDLYSLGVLLYEMLTGELPFDSSSSIATLMAHVNRRAPDVRKRRADVPRWLARLIALLLEKHPSQRLHDAALVLRSLQRRRVPLRYAVHRVRTAVAALVIIALISTASYLWRAHRFARLASDGGTTVSALDRRGHLLWSIHGVHWGTNIVVVHEGGNLAYIAVIRDLGSQPDLQHNHELLLLDPQSGDIVRRVQLADGASQFVDFAPEFHVTGFATADLNGTGDDVIVISYTHRLYWPSYVEVYDPKSRASGIVYYGSGHHRFSGAVDVNGDGRKDLILTGLNNRMGWYPAIVALSLRTTGEPSAYELAVSPDAQNVVTTHRADIWYALMPPGHGLKIKAVDARRKLILLEYDDGRSTAIGFDGFVPGDYARPPNERNRERNRSYDLLRDAVRLRGGGFYADAISAAQHAYEAAQLSEDAMLSEWTRRVYATTLIDAGKYAEAQNELHAIFAGASDPSEVAFDAARQFHLAGSLPRAVEWYRRGLGVHSHEEIGRGRYEYLQGEVLALVELHQWSEAINATRQFEQEFPERPFPEADRQYIQWRRGERIDDPVAVGEGTIDLIRYWRLEFLFRNGAAAGELLRQVQTEEHRASGDTLLLSLEAELEARLGHVERAYDLARKSYEAAVVERRSDTVVRGHFEVIAERYRRLALLARRAVR